MLEYLLEYKDICFRYKNTDAPALKNINFKVKHGEFITILGNSGSGKTTLIKLINRLLIPSQGMILFKGEDVLNKDIFELRRNIGYVVQQVGLFPHMNNEENISIMPNIMKKEKKRLQKKYWNYWALHNYLRTRNL